jgi:hypothetical protein
MRSRLILLFGVVVCTTAGQLPAQAAGDGFFFREPRASLVVFGGFAQPRASSQLFDFTFEELTLGRGDFGAGDFGADLALRVGDRTDLVLGFASSGARKRSEFRDWVDNNDQPIEQTTRFSRAPIGASLRYHLRPRGRGIGSVAWIPTTAFVPWVGIGGGMMQYRFDQAGDFIDYQTLDVFTDRFVSSGWAPYLQGAVGGGWNLSHRWLLNGEMRYVTGRAELGSAFEGFDKLDLSGLTASVGLGFRF